MSKRKIHEGLPPPGFLRPDPVNGGATLEVEAVSKAFGGIRAVTNASLGIASGQIHALIGPNGAGKTTLFNLVSGLFPIDSGSVRLNGVELTALRPDNICQQGIARSFQITNLFRTLSIHENLRLSLQARHPGRFNIWRDVDSYREVHDQTAELMRFLGLEGIETIEGGDLSYGGQRLVDLGIALGSKPQILLLDEPLAGLAAAERDRVANLVKSIAAGIPVLIVEHDIDRVLGFSHRVTVMNQGEVLMAGTPEDVRSDARVQRVYTGTGTPPVTGRVADVARGTQLLKVEKVNTFYGKSHILNDVSLDVREGEIVALLGRNGAGKSTTLKSLMGMVTPHSGEVVLGGENLAGRPAHVIAQAGMQLVPEDRRIFGSLNVEENIILAGLTAQGRWPLERIYDMFPRLKERRGSRGTDLSGGEQQMLAIARALVRDPKIILLDEPFEGLAPVIVRDLMLACRKLVEAGQTIVLVEQNIAATLALANRAYIINNGHIVHEGPTAEIKADPQVLQRYLGV